MSLKPLHFIAGVTALVLIVATIVFLVQSAIDKNLNSDLPLAQKYRFLQPCDAGVVAEYVATRRLSQDEVCAVRGGSGANGEVSP